MMNRNSLFTVFALIVGLMLVGDVQAQRKKPIASKKAVVGQKATLSIEAGLVYKNGDVKPVARAQFFLLDDDLENILKNAAIIEKKDSDGVSEGLSFIDKLGFWKKYPTLYETEYPQAMEVIKKHSGAEVTTDFSGKAEFGPVKAGKYWLMGIGGANQIVIWNLSIDLKAGKQSVTLDNQNSVTIL